MMYWKAKTESKYHLHISIGILCSAFGRDYEDSPNILVNPLLRISPLPSSPSCLLRNVHGSGSYSVHVIFPVCACAYTHSNDLASVHTIVLFTDLTAVFIQKALQWTRLHVIEEQVGVKVHLALGYLQVRLWTLGFNHATFQLGVKHPDGFWSFPVSESIVYQLVGVLNQAQQCGVMTQDMENMSSNYIL